MDVASSTAARRLATVVWFVLVTLVIIQGYLILHEAGHALAAVAVGGTVTGIDARVWSDRPHASYTFGTVTQGQRAFVTAAGTLLPLVVGLAALLALPRQLPARWAVVRIGFAAGALAGLLPWLVLPWPMLQGSAPNDDTVRFTLQSGWPPALVVGVAAATLVGGVALAWWRVGGRDGLRALRRTRSHLLTITPRDVGAVAAGLVVLVLFAVALHAWVGDTAVATGVPTEVPPPPSHAPLFDVRLDGSTFDATFAGGVSDGGTVFLVLRFEELAGGPFRVTLHDAAGEEHVLASFGVGTTMGVASSQPRALGAAGPWYVRLVAEHTVGRIRAWTREPS
ncbi:MAG: hypothetical protein EA416_14075 [Trueperaceae bacterium]|nr:MAG: hypothetical protein EA416_14075 [Trueperaceae bacterium]